MNSWPPDLIQRLKNCRKVSILTGAGISAESGIATFRGLGGQWEKVDPLKLATPEAFAKDPRYVWEWYEARRRQVAGAEPNGGHEVLAWMEDFFPDVALITQNVDRLHHKAGSRRPIELHGSLWMVRCTGSPSCGEWEDRHELVNLPPQCPQCGALLRPGVVWFGEELPREAWAQAEEAARDCDAFFVIGTSALVYPAASLPENPLDRGRWVIEINPEQTPLSNLATFSMRSPAGVALESLREKLLENGNLINKCRSPSWTSYSTTNWFPSGIGPSPGAS
jgi:NAD-dependent deacetylase